MVIDTWKAEDDAAAAAAAQGGSCRVVGLRRVLRGPCFYGYGLAPQAVDGLLSQGPSRPSGGGGGGAGGGFGGEPPVTTTTQFQELLPEGTRLHSRLDGRPGEKDLPIGLDIVDSLRLLLGLGLNEDNEALQSANRQGQACGRR